MPRYLVTAAITVSTHTIVDAPNSVRAKEIAEGRGVSGLGHNACTSDPDECWVVEELDGEPRDLEVEDAC